MFFSQVTTPAAVEAGTGMWIQLVMQFGALGLLAMIVWQIPTLVKSLKEWRTESEQANLKEREGHKAERNDLLHAYREEARYERESCQRHFDQLAQITTSNQQVTQQALNKVGQAVEKVGIAVSVNDKLAKAAMDQMDRMNPPSN